MPKRTKKHKSKKHRTMKHKVRKQKIINMIGCSKRHKHNKSCKHSKSLGCPNCGPNCHCGPDCKCPHPCPGTCYLNRIKKGGSGCGSCSCPVGALTHKQMSQFLKGGEVSNKPVIIDGTNEVSNKFTSILGTSQNGGNCHGMCLKPQAGGSAVPGPFTGSAWGAPIKEWAGMDGIGSNRNYLSSYAGTIANDYQRQLSMSDAGYKTPNSMVGGYTYGNKVKSKTQKGGLIPQDLVNLGRNFTFNLHSAYNSLNGYSQPVDPLPYKDQLTNSNVNGRFGF